MKKYVKKTKQWKNERVKMIALRRNSRITSKKGTRGKEMVQREEFNLE